MITCSLLRRLAIAGFALFLLIYQASPAHADPGDTLRYIRARGALRCGVSEGITGFSIKDAAGRWSGMDVDFCRALAAAILGDPGKVQFIALSATARFPALVQNNIDILARNSTWTVFREPTFGIEFTGVLYYDNEGFITRASSPFARSETLDGAKICVEDGSNQLANITEFSRLNGWKFTPVIAKDFAAARLQLASGGCDVMTDDFSALEEFLLRVPDPSTYTIRPEHAGKEPFSPAVRWDDGAWVALVRAVYAALLDADERGLTQTQAAAIGTASADPAIAAYLSETVPAGRAFGIAPGWAAKAVAAAGNYSEMFKRNLGAGSPLKLDPGPNRPWTEGGLLYAPPFQ